MDPSRDKSFNELNLQQSLMLVTVQAVAGSQVELPRPCVDVCGDIDRERNVDFNRCRICRRIIYLRLVLDGITMVRCQNELYGYNGIEILCLYRYCLVGVGRGELNCAA